MSMGWIGAMVALLGMGGCAIVAWRIGGKAGYGEGLRDGDVRGFMRGVERGRAVERQAAQEAMDAACEVAKGEALKALGSLGSIASLETVDDQEGQEDGAPITPITPATPLRAIAQAHVDAKLAGFNGAERARMVYQRIRWAAVKEERGNL